MNKYYKYIKDLLNHKYWVYKAGRKMKVPFLRCIFHDMSKLSPTEFMGYANYNFKGDNTEKNTLNFETAWLHHQRVNKHHWNYWVSVSSTNKIYPVEMPETYIREMIADWMGFERGRFGTWDMSHWLSKNWNQFIITQETRNKLQELLEGLGYTFSGTDEGICITYQNV